MKIEEEARKLTKTVFEDGEGIQIFDKIKTDLEKLDNQRKELAEDIGFKLELVDKKL